MSKDILIEMKKHKLINKNTKYQVLPNPVEYSNDCQSEDSEFVFDKDLFYIINCGSLSDQKNHKMLIEAFKIVHDNFKKTRLIIIGDGFLKKKLNDLVKSLNLTDYIYFIYSSKNVKYYFRNSNLFVLTSKYEGFGLVLVEAISCGLTVISNNCKGAPKDILQNGKYGILIDDCNKIRLAESILNYIKKPLIFDNKEILAKYNSNKVSESWLEFIVK